MHGDIELAKLAVLKNLAARTEGESVGRLKERIAGENISPSEFGIKDIGSTELQFEEGDITVLKNDPRIIKILEQLEGKEIAQINMKPTIEETIAVKRKQFFPNNGSRIHL